MSDELGSGDGPASDNVEVPEPANDNEAPDTGEGGADGEASTGGGQEPNEGGQEPSEEPTADRDDVDATETGGEEADPGGGDRVAGGAPPNQGEESAVPTDDNAGASETDNVGVTEPANDNEAPEADAGGEASTGGGQGPNEGGQKPSEEPAAGGEDVDATEAASNDRPPDLAEGDATGDGPNQEGEEFAPEVANDNVEAPNDNTPPEPAGGDGPADADPGLGDNFNEAAAMGGHDSPTAPPGDEVPNASVRDEGADDRAGLRDVPSFYPDDYMPSNESPPSVDRPHVSPELWADGINPDKAMPGRDVNCGECSRNTQLTWAGDPGVAAAMSDPETQGEPYKIMVEAVGVTPETTSISEIGYRLEQAGPGSSAIVGVDWNSGGGHWFNAVNDGGIVKAVDGQTGRIEPWPPSNVGLGFSESDMSNVDAIWFAPDGSVES